jgi:hypothetical protein
MWLDDGTEPCLSLRYYPRHTRVMKLALAILTSLIIEKMHYILPVRQPNYRDWVGHIDAEDGDSFYSDERYRFR